MLLLQKWPVGIATASRLQNIANPIRGDSRASDHFHKKNLAEPEYCLPSLPSCENLKAKLGLAWYIKNNYMMEKDFL